MNDESPEGGGVIDGECILVPDGEYELRYKHYETVTYFGRPKVRVRCAIVGPEEWAGLPVDRFYNVSKLTSPARKFGDFVASRKGDLIREYRQLVGDPVRPDRISFRFLKGKRLIGELATVTTDHRRSELSKINQYSGIVKFLRIDPEDDWN